jgi:hypothetical protein
MDQRNPTHRKVITFAGMFLISILCGPTPAQGANLPFNTVQNMCFTADLIVAGEHLGDGKVRVDHVFYVSLPRTKMIKTLDIPSIPQHSKIIDEVFVRGQDVRPITTKRLVLFLVKGKYGKFEPINMVGKGSHGLFWYDKGVCYGYEQPENPGPYCLERSRAGDSRGRIPHGKDAMWDEIKIGLKQRRQWEAIEGIEDPAERALQMAAYLLPHTAPEGYSDAVDLRRAIRKIGPEAVPALVEVLQKARANDNLNTTVLTLYDIGRTSSPEALRPAVPALCKLLANPGPTSPYYILSPLKVAADPRAILYVRPMLRHKSKQVRGQAARALAAMKDQESFHLIATLIEDPPNPKDRLGYTLELARSLFELDPVRARPIIEQIESNPGNAGIHYFIHGYH